LVSRVISRVTDGAFGVSEIPRFARRAFAIEAAATFCVTVCLAMIEGGVIAVFAKQSFEGKVQDSWLNLAVGLLGALGEFANILSFYWSSVSQGRPKVGLLRAMQAVVAVCVAMVAFVNTQSASGLVMLLVIVVVARVCWSGIVTIRPTLWRANYPPAARMKIVGTLASLQIVNAAVLGAALAWVMDARPDAYRYFLFGAAAVALLGVYLYGRLRIRREWRMLREEREEPAARVMKPWHGPLVVWRTLREDRWYARFMLWMFVLGFSNLTILPTLVISLRDEFGFSRFGSVLVVSSVPYAMTLVAMPFWRRFLDRTHVVAFRAVHSWTFVAASLFYTLGALTHSVWLYFVGAACMGVGFGGGSIAWNIGHVDFARPSETSRYMATHVTLNGVRGLLAPLAVTSAYEWLRLRGFDAHLWVQSVSLLIAVAGALGFVQLKRSMGKLVATHSRV
jgi:MFS family permease